MRFGESPLTIVGIDQEDNQFRTSTPALLKHTERVVMVDHDEAYARKLQMFSDDVSFHSPTAIREVKFVGARRLLEATVTSEEPVPSKLESLPPEESSSLSWLWLTPVALIFVAKKYLVPTIS
jgi:hypothetical protein